MGEGREIFEWYVDTPDVYATRCVCPSVSVCVSVWVCPSVLCLLLSLAWCGLSAWTCVCCESVRFWLSLGSTVCVFPWLAVSVLRHLCMLFNSVCESVCGCVCCVSLYLYRCVWPADSHSGSAVRNFAKPPQADHPFLHLAINKLLHRHPSTELIHAKWSSIFTTINSKTLNSGQGVKGPMGTRGKGKVGKV